METGDKHRAFHQIQELSAHHEVVLVALNEGPVAPEHLDKVRDEVCPNVYVIERSRATTLMSTAKAALTGVPLQVGYFQSPSARRQLDAIIEREQPDHLYCQLIRTAPLAKGRSIPSTIDYQDAFSTSTTRRAEQSGFPMNLVWRLEAARTAKYEEKVFDWFDRHVIISAQDRDSMDFAGAETIELATSAVDPEDFHPMPPPPDQRDITFVGNMGYPPNVAAAVMLADEILPLVAAERPDTTLLVAGARPAKAVRALEGGPVTVTGWVDDIRDAYRGGKVMVAPLLIGAGQQNKILEAMAMGVPCVTTELVNSAIGAEPGREILIARTPEEFSRHIVDLLASEEDRAAMSEAARQFVIDRYSWPSIGRALDEVMSRGARQR